MAPMFSINPGRRDGCASLILSAATERGLGRHDTSPPEQAAIEPGVVHIHAFHPELLAELLEPIASAWPGARPELLISVPEDGTGTRQQACQQVLERVFAENAPACQWLTVENRGRNLRPLLLVLHQLAQRQQAPSWLLHLHTKQTLDPTEVGSGWRQDLVQKLIGSRSQINGALRLLSDSSVNPPIGLVAPCRYSGIERQYHWGGNFQIAVELAEQLFPDKRLHPDQLLVFPAGLMFWCRPQALQPLLSLPVDPAWYPAEPLGTNGTVLHALERLICHCVEAAGWQWRLLDAAIGSATPVADGAAWPSVWERRSDIYQQLLSQYLREGQKQLRIERQRSLDLALQLHQQQRLQRCLLWPFTPQQPLKLALILQQAGKGHVSSAHIRLLEPLRLLEEQGRCIVRIVNQPDLASLCGVDLLITQRGALANVASAETLHSTCLKLKIPLIVDIDDALFSLPLHHGERQHYLDRSAATDLLLSRCDHAVFSTTVLRDCYRQHLSTRDLDFAASCVIANGLSPRLWHPEGHGLPARRPLTNSLPLQLLYMGSATHDDDFQMLLPQLDKLANSHPGSFQLHVIGALNAPPERPWLQLRPVPLQARRYPQFVQWLLQRRPYHCGIAPLRAHPFNACKSDVKVLDYAALGLGSLCSSGPAYDALIAQGLALGTTNDGWQAALEALLQDPRPVQECGRRAQRYLWRRRSCVRVAEQLWHVLKLAR